jgi:hypothetical protein
MLDARRQSSGSDSDSSDPGSAGPHPQVARSQPQPQERLLPRGSAGDELHRPPVAPEENAKDLTSNTQTHEPTEFDLQKRPRSSAGDEDNALSSAQGSQTQWYPPESQDDNTSQLPYSYGYSARHKPTDTGTYSMSGALPSPVRVVPGRSFAPEDRYGHVAGEPETSSATRTPTMKAFQTVHDHTTNQLDDGRKEYIPRQVDPSGETKVSKDGHPLGGRTFRCRTFQLPGYGETLFMLNTECARILGYRDSDVLFNENRSLFKIYLTYTGKAYLIERGVSFYSYESEELAIVTARSMFRQFGARLIRNGRRVRDDYWEADARQQGFTEEDDASETTPGAARAREDVPAQSNHTGRRHTLWRTFKF